MKDLLQNLLTFIIIHLNKICLISRDFFWFFYLSPLIQYTTPSKFIYSKFGRNLKKFWEKIVYMLWKVWGKYLRSFKLCQIKNYYEEYFKTFTYLSHSSYVVTKFNWKSSKLKDLFQNLPTFIIIHHDKICLISRDFLWFLYLSKIL